MWDQADSVVAEFTEAWDGWRGVRIGSPVVVSGICKVPRDDVGPLRNFQQVT